MTDAKYRQAFAMLDIIQNDIVEIPKSLALSAALVERMIAMHVSMGTPRNA